MVFYQLVLGGYSRGLVVGYSWSGCQVSFSSRSPGDTSNLGATSKKFLTNPLSYFIPYLTPFLQGHAL